MRPYIDDMRKNIADALKIDVDRVNVKATTEEGLGFTGSERVFLHRQYAHLILFLIIYTVRLI